MADFGVFIGFSFPTCDPEAGAVRSFQELLQYLDGQVGQGNVASFEPVFLPPRSGHLGGFVLARGERKKLDQMVATPEFQRLATRPRTVVVGAYALPSRVRLATPMTVHTGDRPA